MAKANVFIVVSTYPLPSRSYDELVCTAGFLEDGRWIRIYPVPFQFLNHRKYQWVELDLIPQDRSHDFRPESYSPKEPNLSDLKIISSVGTKQAWYERKQLCLNNTYTNMTLLVEHSKEPKNVSLAAFKPIKVRKFIVEDDEREWKQQWLDQLRQIDMFTQGHGETSDKARIPIDKIPYKFKYQFEDDAGHVSNMTIEDWEIGALYRNCLRNAEGNEQEALRKVKMKYEEDFIKNKDITLFLGTTLEHHRRRHSNPFTIVGVFYPPRVEQTELFL